MADLHVVSQQVNTLGVGRLARSARIVSRDTSPSDDVIEQRALSRSDQHDCSEVEREVPRMVDLAC